MIIEIPELSLVLLVGPSGCGKSTLARAHFRPTEVLSSDACRALVADDERDQSATADAFAVLHAIADKRLARGRLTVVDATSVQARARKPLVELARHHNVSAVAIVLDLPEALCVERSAARADRVVGAEVIHRQIAQLHESLPALPREGFAAVHVLRDPEALAALRVVRRPLPPNRAGDHGPFDIVGDVHGCAEELHALLRALGYAPTSDGGWRHPAGRRVVFVGDLVDRGPDIAAVLRTAMAMSRTGDALCVAGNHDDKLLRKLRGRNVQIKHGLQQSLDALAQESVEFRVQVERFLGGLASHYVLDDGRLVVAHAGMTQALQGRESDRVRDFAMYGETTGGTDEYGLPVRLDWAASYHGAALVVYGHTPVAEPRWKNHTVNIDTGCVFGGALTALRYPELTTVSVPAARAYAETRRPFLPTPPAPAPAPAAAS